MIADWREPDVIRVAPVPLYNSFTDVWKFVGILKNCLANELSGYNVRWKMKVDMSPKAVTQRLKTMDELWLLSVKLMNSKKIKTAKDEKDELSDNARDSRVKREKNRFEPHVFEYVEKGGTRASSAILGVDEHAVIKTLIFETNEKKPLIILMHGDLAGFDEKSGADFKCKIRCARCGGKS